MAGQTLNQRLESVWNDAGKGRRSVAGFGDRLLRGGLRAASTAWGAGTLARSATFRLGLRRTRRVGCPVICIGNLTVGGTGKTPLVIEIAEFLQGEGLRVAVVSRGYRRRARPGVLVVSDGERIRARGSEAGDEPMMIARRLPGVAVVVGADRYAAARAARSQCSAQVILLDDGFQHRSLARDCDIVLWDTLRRPESLALLPRGPMRESLGALRRAHALVFTRSNLGHGTGRIAARIKRVAPHLLLFHGALRAEELIPLHGGAASHPPAALEGKAIAAFCALGNPRSFWRLLETTGARLTETRIFPDHYRPAHREIEAFAERGRNAGAQWIVTTEKDRENLPEDLSLSLPIYFLRVRTSFGEDAGRFGSFIEQFAMPDLDRSIDNR